ncbi:MAG: hypothetical protein ACUZ8O_04055, partial [Candidatus Anammoxibacter sp.]
SYGDKTLINMVHNHVKTNLILTFSRDLAGKTGNTDHPIPVYVDQGIPEYRDHLIPVYVDPVKSELFS